MNKAQMGFAKKHNIGSFKSLYEIRVKKENQTLPEVGADISIEDLSVDMKMDVMSVSKGKGFQGVVKRWNFSTQDATHGNSLSHRAPGSIGGNQPGRVWKGQKMSGHMGSEQVTLKNRTVVGVEKESSLVLVKGGVPGCNGSSVVITQEN